MKVRIEVISDNNIDVTLSKVYANMEEIASNIYTLKK